MEETRALNRLLEASDLLGMIESLIISSSNDKMSLASWSGVRITIKNVRETILASHDVLAQDITSPIPGKQLLRSVGAGNGTSSMGSAINNPNDKVVLEKNNSSAGESPIAEPKPLISRRDLRTAIERVIERA